MTDIFRFDWPVDQVGYEIVKEEEGHEMRRSVEVIRGRGGAPRYYRPMNDKPGLWREFAEICRSRDGVLDFVGNFGLLCEPALLDEVLETAALIQKIAGALDAGAVTTAADLFNQYARPQLTTGIGTRVDSRRSKLALEFIPRTLHAALLLQAAQAITGNLQFRRCGNCSTWFRYGPGTGRTVRRQFCSDRCRVAWARHNKTRTAHA